MQITLLLQISLPSINSSNHITGRVIPDQMDTLEGIFNWLGVLWEQGFYHENPQGTMTTLDFILTIFIMVLHWTISKFYISSL